MSLNLASMHREACERFGSRTALRFRRWGRYQDLSWNDYRRMVENAAAGLLELGVRPGDRIAILSENRYEWLVADYAVLCTGAADVPLHAPLAPAQVEYQCGHSGSKGIIVSGQEQADKVLAVLDRLPELEFLVSFEPVEVGGRIPAVTFAGLQSRGRQAGANAFHEIAKREAELTGEDLATIIYTSGTTGNPKGVMLTHHNLQSNAELTLQVFCAGPEDVILSWLPYSHIYARTVDHYLTTRAGVTVALAESMNTLLADLAMVHPHWLTSVPRFYEKIWSSVEGLDAQTRKSALKRIFGPRLRHLTSGGAPLPKHVCEGFFASGVPLLEGYGLTESSPVISFNAEDDYRVGTVGKPIPEVEVKIAADGEILTRGPHVMRGYWKNPEATAETIVDGWLHTGDVGELDEDGFLSITDRKKDLIITSGGKNIAPSELERLLVSDPLIDQAVVYGDGRPFVSALLVPNFPELEKQASELGCTLEIEGDFICSRPLCELLQSRVDEVMQAVSQPERVRTCLVLGRPFQLEEDELTATLKVRRRHIISKFAEPLAALYEKCNAAEGTEPAP